jgi:lipid-A-disaccharide synthase
VNAEFVGHPYFDELRGQWLDRRFLSEQRARGGVILGLLPGSRDREVRANLPTLIEAAAVIRRQRPETRFLVACFKKSQAEYVRRELARQGAAIPAIEVHDGRTPEIIHLAHSCIAVSGSVSLELLYRGKPAVVIYRTPLLELTVFHLLRTCKFVSLVNLLADRQIFPEYVTRHNEGPAAAAHIVNWLDDPRAHAQVCGELARLRQQVAEPGACDRAAGHILQLIADRSRRAA